MNIEYCNCKNQQPEEVKRGVFNCLSCNHPINPADFATDEPELSDEEVEFYQDSGRQYIEREVFGL